MYTDPSGETHHNQILEVNKFKEIVDSGGMRTNKMEENRNDLETRECLHSLQNRLEEITDSPASFPSVQIC